MLMPEWLSLQRNRRTLLVEIGPYPVASDGQNGYEGCGIVAELTSMRNIGVEIEKKLKAIGIGSAEELERVGSRAAFVRLKVHYPNVCLVHLYTLQGAIDGIEYNQLSEETKRELKDYSDALK